MSASLSFGSGTAVTIALGILTAAILGSLAMGIFGGNHMPVDGKTILITGGSEGLGLEAAKRLAAKGANIILVARTIHKLELALTEIRATAKSPSQRFHYLAANVSEPAYAKGIVAAAMQWNNGQAPDIVWCVAGSSAPMLFADKDAMMETRRSMDVNFFGAAEMAYAILQEWWAAPSTTSPGGSRPQQPKHLIFTASVLAFYTIAGYSTYSPAKWALRGLADTLAQEALLYPDQPVKIHIVYPGTILTAGFDREQMTKPDITKHLEKDDPQLTADQAAERAIKGLEQGKPSVTVGLLGEAMRWGVMGGSFKNNWFLDMLTALLIAPIWPIVLLVMHGDIKGWAKKHGHPGTHSKAL